MRSVNKVILVGRLGADPEVREMSSGKPVMNFRIAVSESWNDKSSGERKERTEWINIVCMNERTVEALEKFLKKGMLIYVEGKMQTRKWTDKDGNDRYTTEVMVGPGGEINVLEHKDDDGGRRDDRRGRDDDRRTKDDGRRGSGSRYSGGSRGAGRDDMSDDIPF